MQDEPTSGLDARAAAIVMRTGVTDALSRFIPSLHQGPHTSLIYRQSASALSLCFRKRAHGQCCAVQCATLSTPAAPWCAPSTSRPSTSSRCACSMLSHAPCAVTCLIYMPCNAAPIEMLMTRLVCEGSWLRPSPECCMRCRPLTTCCC